MPHGTSRWKPSDAKRPLARRQADEQSIRERAAFVANRLGLDVNEDIFEQSVVVIEIEIRRFARDRYLL
jgi:hypothetical protein